MSPSSEKPPIFKPGLHPRNVHRGRYDFPRLIQSNPALAEFVRTNEHGDASIDFANAEAVKTLNQTLLKHFYGIDHWDIPPQYLCPPIPGRADYLHSIADLLSEGKETSIPRGKSVIGLDIGVGANVIYPIIGSQTYGWRFFGSDIDAPAIQNVQKIVAANARLQGLIEGRLQKNRRHIFNGIVGADERFDFTLCNPPFHTSAEEAAAGTQRKVRNLSGRKVTKPILNFGGKNAELWCEGGELAFVQRMISESKSIAKQCLWFTSLISKSANLPAVYRALNNANVFEEKTIEMAQGQKKSRFVAWTFLDKNQQDVWKTKRW